MKTYCNARLILSFTAALLLAAATVEAAVRELTPSEPSPSARRTAARELERLRSTQWMPDVADRMQILSESAKRAAEGATRPLVPAAPRPTSRAREGVR